MQCVAFRLKILPVSLWESWYVAIGFVGELVGKWVNVAARYNSFLRRILSSHPQSFWRRLKVNTCWHRLAFRVLLFSLLMSYIAAISSNRRCRGSDLMCAPLHLECLCLNCILSNLDMMVMCRRLILLFGHCLA